MITKKLIINTDNLKDTTIQKCILDNPDLPEEFVRELLLMKNLNRIDAETLIID